MRKIFFFFALWALCSFGLPATASVFNVDLTQPGGIPGTGGTTSYVGPCYCISTTFFSPVYAFNPGDIVNFGSVEIFSFQSGPTPDAGPNQAPLFLEGIVTASFDSSIRPPLAFPSLQFYTPQAPATYELLYAIPQGTHSIQLAWYGPYDYIAPSVPEPSTWAMLLIGFAGIGFAGYRRSWPNTTYS